MSSYINSSVTSILTQYIRYYYSEYHGRVSVDCGYLCDRPGIIVTITKDYQNNKNPFHYEVPHGMLYEMSIHKAVPIIVEQIEQQCKLDNCMEILRKTLYD